MDIKEYNALLRHLRKFCRQLTELVTAEFDDPAAEVTLIELSDRAGPDATHYTVRLRAGFFIPSWDVERNYPVGVARFNGDYISGPEFLESVQSIMQDFAHLHNELLGAFRE